jgi:hypothetical protein
MGAMWRSSIPNSVINRIVAHVNRKAWWHVPPQDPMAYSKRGKFFASSFAEAEFYGRPLGSGMLKTSLKSGQLKRFSGLPPTTKDYFRGIEEFTHCSLVRYA